MTTKQASELVAELSVFVRRKHNEGISMEMISVSLMEMGCATAFLMGLAPNDLADMLPRLMKRGEDFVEAIKNGK